MNRARVVMSLQHDDACILRPGSFFVGAAFTNVLRGRCHGVYVFILCSDIEF